MWEDLKESQKGCAKKGRKVTKVYYKDVEN